MLRPIVRLLFLLLLSASFLLFAGAKKEEKHQVDQKTCIGCTLCVQSCPTKAITMVEDAQKAKKAVIDPEKCINCTLCVQKCPTKAIHGPTAAPAPAPAAPAAEKKTK